MAEYLISEETMDAMANHARRISNTEDALNAAEIAEILSRTEGSIKEATDGTYEVRALNAGGGVIKSGMYDTDEVFALPKSAPDIKGQFTKSDGTTEWKTIATFDGWSATAPRSCGYVKVGDTNIDIGALYKPVDDCIVIVVNVESAGTALTLRINYVKEVDWGDGTVTTYGSNTSTHTHTYSLAGKFLIKIPNNENEISITLDIGADSTTKAAIEGIAIPKWINRSDGRGLWTGFNSLKKLEYCLLEEGVVFGERVCFDNCQSLEYITLPNSVASFIPEVMFRQPSGATIALKSIVLPYGITEISANCFNRCTNLEKIIIPSSVTSIGEGAFSYCSSLTGNLEIGNNVTTGSLVIPDSVTSIEDWTFGVCDGLTSVTIGNNVTSIGANAFYDCDGLASVTIGNNVTSIGANAFYNCDGLSVVTFKGTPTSINSSAFYGCFSSFTINVPWAEGAVANAPWGATHATINYNYAG